MIFLFSSYGYGSHASPSYSRSHSYTRTYSKPSYGYGHDRYAYSVHFIYQKKMLIAISAYLYILVDLLAVLAELSHYKTGFQYQMM